MANTAQVLITEAVALGYDALSDRDLKECLLVVARGGSQSGSNAKTLLALAASLDYDALSARGVLLDLVGYFASVLVTSAKAAMVLAASYNYAALSDFELDQSFLNVLATSGGPITAQAFATAIGMHGYDKLSWREVADCQLAATQVSSAADAQSLVAAAAVENNPALSARDESECLLASIQ